MFIVLQLPFIFPDGGRSLEGSHMSLYTKINGIYYVTDVGFGDLPLHAIPITNVSQPTVISDINGEFRAILDTEDHYYVQKLKTTNGLRCTMHY